MPTIGSVSPVDINEEVKKSYLDYAMSVIVGRALPDVRDGLKPVHRRILYAMFDAGITPDKPHKKSAVVVGNVLARFHPHGDAAVYDALVRLAQDFSCRYPLVDGHGNFGSIDGDAPAAMRYTEVRLAPLALQMLADIDQETVDFVPNYDDSQKEPAVLPSRIPNLLVNGSSGIAVGMATNIPPHNLREVIDGLVYLIDHPEASVADLMQYIPGPDFPSGGSILGLNGIKEAYETGRGALVVRGRAEIEKTSGGRSQIVITELPFQVNKARLVERIAELVREKKLDGISDLRDESDRSGMRVVLELRREANPRVILNRLYKHTKLQDTFGVIMLALVDGTPRILNLKELLSHYLEHQVTVVRRRSQYQLRRAEERLHIVDGLVIALDHIDAVISLIRRSHTDEEARRGLMGNFQLSEKQAQAILDMRLRRLTGLEREKVLEEKRELEERIAGLKELLSNESLIRGVVRQELLEVREKFGDDRRTLIAEKAPEVRKEDIIPEELVVITLTRRGYIKRIPLNTYRGQHRGGRGITALTTRDEDFVEQLFAASTHHFLLFFTNKGKVYRLKVYDIPEGSRQAKGTALVNLLPLAADEVVTAVIPLRQFRDDRYLLMATRQGLVKKGLLSDYDSSRRDGIIALRLHPGDELIGVRLSEGREEIILATKKGMALCFNEEDVRVMGRAASGVLGIRLDPGDEVVGMDRFREGSQVLVVTERGYGKRTPAADYRVQKRGGRGLITLKVTDRNGCLAGVKVVDDRDEILLMSSEDSMIRIRVGEIPVQGRNTQGVKLMRLKEDERLVAVAKLPSNSIEGMEKVN
ncbi:DNA gyrase subunit alpha [Thermacetogenium phaeum DSM 12270]|uniref:DNA gyrase subunit A n=1 Tax=Thermacetogenium phaeum (strain ATCC BAA-254 / DSM 26808 / PB) TaxID=1089553 RepID=K4LDX1_THEPS|nr:DNA gyrase subunit A [Thermacetogenium phaeum]AFV10267.1 DNA gyrase subunit alpha [Thermacetogenium phaeum DSM 12270]